MGLYTYTVYLRCRLGLYSLGVSVSTSVSAGVHMYMYVGWVGSEALPRRWPVREVCIVHMNAGPKPYSEELSPLGRRLWIANSTNVV